MTMFIQEGRLNLFLNLLAFCFIYRVPYLIRGSSISLLSDLLGRKLYMYNGKGHGC